MIVAPRWQVLLASPTLRANIAGYSPKVVLAPFTLLPKATNACSKTQVAPMHHSNGCREYRSIRQKATQDWLKRGRWSKVRFEELPPVWRRFVEVSLPLCTFYHVMWLTRNAAHCPHVLASECLPRPSGKDHAMNRYGAPPVHSGFVHIHKHFTQSHTSSFPNRGPPPSPTRGR